MDEGGTAERKGVSLKAILCVIGLGLAGFGLLAGLVSADATYAFDHAVLTWLRVPGDLSQPVFSDWLVDPMSDITALGGYTALAMLTFGAALYYIVLKDYLTAGLVIAAIGSSGLLTFLLKLGFDRARPELAEHLTHSTNSSFPSGHALQSSVAYLIIGALLACSQRNPSIRTLIWVGAISLTFLVGLSRVYLGVHWPTDILAGWCLGAAWAALWWLVLGRFASR